MKKFRAIINSLDDCPEIKEVTLLPHAPTQNGMVVVTAPSGNSWFHVVGTGEDKSIVIKYSSVDTCSLLCHPSELYDTALEAVRSLKQAYEAKILIKCREIAKLHNSLEELP